MGGLITLGSFFPRGRAVTLSRSRRGNADTPVSSDRPVLIAFFLKVELINKKFLRNRKLNFYHFGSVSTKNGSERDRFNESEKIAAQIYPSTRG